MLAAILAVGILALLMVGPVFLQPNVAGPALWQPNGVAISAAGWNRIAVAGNPAEDPPATAEADGSSGWIAGPFLDPESPLSSPGRLLTRFGPQASVDGLASAPAGPLLQDFWGLPRLPVPRADQPFQAPRRLPPPVDAATSALSAKTLLPPGNASGAVPALVLRRGGLAPIAGAEILANAGRWLGIAYVWGGTTVAGLDCSAFLSRAWGVSRQTTDTLYRVAYPITRDELLPGDALNLTTGEDPRGFGHVRLFAGWANAERTMMWVYEETPPRSVYHAIRYDPRYTPMHRYDYRPSDSAGLSSPAELVLGPIRSLVGEIGLGGESGTSPADAAATPRPAVGWSALVPVRRPAWPGLNRLPAADVDPGSAIQSPFLPVASPARPRADQPNKPRPPTATPAAPAAAQPNLSDGNAADRSTESLGPGPQEATGRGRPPRSTDDRQPEARRPARPPADGTRRNAEPAPVLPPTASDRTGDHDEEARASRPARTARPTPPAIATTPVLAATPQRPAPSNSGPAPIDAAPVAAPAKPRPAPPTLSPTPSPAAAAPTRSPGRPDARQPADRSTDRRADRRPEGEHADRDHEQPRARPKADGERERPQHEAARSGERGANSKRTPPPPRGATRQ